MKNGMGSSPRMRGTRGRHHPHGQQTGIIPAYAGNTNPRQLKRFSARDHPRVCGEHVVILSCRNYLRGSSPRMRGTLQSALFVCTAQGIIPAYAGNTSVNCQPRRNARDHPRVCGEHWQFGAESEKLEGSSPRMRGTPYLSEEFATLPGIIPAYAGNTSIFSTPTGMTRDHPRVCGEHRQAVSIGHPPEGSSPRMRGTL